MRALTGRATVNDGSSGRDGHLWLAPIGDAPFAFEVAITGAAPGSATRTFRVTGPALAGDGRTTTSEERLRERSHNAYLDVFEALAHHVGTRVPRNRQPPVAPDFSAPYQPLLTVNLSPDVRHGYGDPAVLRVSDEGDEPWYYLLATSNDAPDAFPITRSRDLREWTPVGFVFPRGHKPAWAADGEHVSDYWAPEMHRIAGEFRVYFSARERADHTLAIGVATSPRPDGPFTAMDVPLLRGDVIDPHVVVGPDGTANLFWKEDANGVWPNRLNRLLHAHGRLITELFASTEDRRTASLLAALWPWVRTLEPMERFFVQQVLVEAVTGDFTGFQQRLAALAERAGDASVRDAMRGVLAVMRTPSPRRTIP